LGALIGKYVVEGFLGEGQVGRVLAARHKDHGKRAALKVSHTSDRESCVEFRRSAHAMMRLQSAYAVRVDEVGQTPAGIPWVAMELLEGQDLSAMLSTDGALGIDESLRYVTHACEALVEAHEIGLLHRGMKPRNLFLARTPKGVPSIRVLDFGLSFLMASARRADLRDGEAQSPHAGTVIEAAHYLAPEQVRGEALDRRTDVWGVGACLFRLLTNRFPFSGNSPGDVCKRILGDVPGDLRRLRADIPPGVEEVIRQCLQKAPRDRFQGMEALLEALRGAQQEGRNTPVVVVAMTKSAFRDGTNDEPRPTPVVLMAHQALDEMGRISEAPMTPVVTLRDPVSLFSKLRGASASGAVDARDHTPVTPMMTLAAPVRPPDAFDDIPVTQPMARPPTPFPLRPTTPSPTAAPLPPKAAPPVADSPTRVAVAAAAPVSAPLPKSAPILVTEIEPEILQDGELLRPLVGAPSLAVAPSFPVAETPLGRASHYDDEGVAELSPRAKKSSSLAIGLALGGAFLLGAAGLGFLATRGPRHRSGTSAASSSASALSKSAAPIAIDSSVALVRAPPPASSPAPSPTPSPTPPPPPSPPPPPVVTPSKPSPPPTPSPATPAPATAARTQRPRPAAPSPPGAGDGTTDTGERILDKRK
jgi:serine/threonine-protein kinase